MKPLILDKYKNLFKDEKSFEKFVKKIESLQNFSNIIVDEKSIGYFVDNVTISKSFNKGLSND